MRIHKRGARTESMLFLLVNVTNQRKLDQWLRQIPIATVETVELNSAERMSNITQDSSYHRSDAEAQGSCGGWSKTFFAGDVDWQLRIFIDSGIDMTRSNLAYIW